MYFYISVLKTNFWRWIVHC